MAEHRHTPLRLPLQRGTNLTQSLSLQPSTRQLQTRAQAMVLNKATGKTLIWGALGGFNNSSRNLHCACLLTATYLLCTATPPVECTQCKCLQVKTPQQSSSQTEVLALSSCTPRTEECPAEYWGTQALSDTQGTFLTMISSSRSGDSTRGMITWFRSSGVFSFFRTLFKVFSCPESKAKLSRTEGLEKQIKKIKHGKGMPHRPFLSSSLKWLRSEETTLLVLKSVYPRQWAVKPMAEYAGVDKPQS